ncbi:glycosyltransferase family 4 protein [Methylobacterium trifolii]|uniref:D-inositol-3-phosphate glycosyltransferase n=1 Tax=Methylobacterium trifolii TaxID=1003092 RepID=A0ABQ4TUG3_9HYPH|nr:glycosyltransferase family 1 protein [Methylobacterium trifolii]GJE58870.1 D-inositol-3-phosphate glycosyltransferase [Methylobacterium trifolii]
MAGAGRRILIDVSTSLRWKGHNPVGIVRTERELVQYFLEHCPDAAFFIYDTGEDTFWLVPKRAVAAIFQEPQARAASVPVAGQLDENVLLRFQREDVVFSVGLQWDIAYMARLYAEKKRRGMFVVQTVYDIIPILMPEYCVPGMEQKFPKFIVDTAWTADLIFCISDSTSRDLIRYYDHIGLKAPPVTRIELGSDIPTTRPPTTQAAGESGFLDLEAGNFVLYVSTIEPRKNHQMLFNIWRELYETDRERLVPLVFVGNAGWNTSELLHFIRSSGNLYPDYIRILSNVADDDLDWLYRNARLSVYPSLYEGWGLPMAESLARGTVCIGSNTSSMPEVGGALTDLLHPLDYLGWRDRIRHYLTDAEALAAREAEIRAGYAPPSWDACMAKFSRDLFEALDRREVPQ